MSMIDRVTADIESVTSIEEIDAVIEMLAARKQDIKREQLLNVIKSVYIDCWVKWKVSDQEHVGQVERINRDYARAIDKDGKANMVFFRQIVEVSDVPFETKKKRAKKEVVEEPFEIVPEIA